MDAPTAAHDAIVQMIDTSVVPMGRSRGGLTGKIHAVVDANAAPVQLGLTAGELPITNSRLSYWWGCKRKLSCLQIAAMTLIDQGIRSRARWVGQHAAETRSQGSDALILTERANLVGRFFNKIKQCRRVASRYDKLATNYLVFIKLASIRKRATP
jgi:transposase